MQYSTRYIDVAHRVARHVARRCSYSFKINSIVFSVRLNPPIPIFSFQYEVFHEIHRCRTSVRATCRATLQLRFQSQFHRVQRTPKPSNTNFQLSICRFNERYRCRISCRATCRDMSCDVAATDTKPIPSCLAYA